MTEKSHQTVHVKEEQKGMVKNMSRRNFLNTAGSAAVGGLVAVAGSSLFTGRKAKAADAPQEAPPLPWKYTKLDPMEAGKRGYENYLLRGG
jgi:hypothetical protein